MMSDIETWLVATGASTVIFTVAAIAAHLRADKSGVFFYGLFAVMSLGGFLLGMTQRR